MGYSVTGSKCRTANSVTIRAEAVLLHVVHNTPNMSLTNSLQNVSFIKMGTFSLTVRGALEHFLGTFCACMWPFMSVFACVSWWHPEMQISDRNKKAPCTQRHAASFSPLICCQHGGRAVLNNATHTHSGCREEKHTHNLSFQREGDILENVL